MRSQGQTLIGCWCEKAFLLKIDEARGGQSRSQFCRDALKETLQRKGIKVGLRETTAPDRTGKGGPKKAKLVSRPKV